MPTVSAGSSATETLTARSTITISAVDGAERSNVVVLRSGAQIFGDRVSMGQSLGPFLSGDVVTIAADFGALDYTVVSAPLVGDVPDGSGNTAFTAAQVSAITSSVVGADGSVLVTSGGAVPALQTWYRALANRDYAPAKIVVLGDSIAEYRMAQAFGRQWVHKFRDRLRLKYQTSGIGSGGGIGYVPIRNVSIFAPYANPFTLAGATTLDVTVGLGLRAAVFSTVADTATGTFTGTTAYVHYLQAATSRIFSTNIDAAGAVNKDTNGGSVSDTGIHTVSLGASAAHSLQIKFVSGGACYLQGVFICDGDEAKGIHVYEAGHTGYRATDYNAQSANVCARINAIAPHLVIIALGENEFSQASGSGQRTSAQFKSDVQTLIASLRAAGITASFLVMTPFDTTGVASNAEPWSAYVAAAASISASDTGGTGGASAVAHLALSGAGRLPPTAGLAGGLYLDTLHPGDQGHSWIADIVTQAVSPA